MRKASFFAIILLCCNVAHAQDGWLLFRGNAQRTGAAANLPVWEIRQAWQRPLLKDEGDPDEEAETLIAKLRKDADPSILPGSFPLIVNDLCVYRSHRDVRCVTLQGLEIKAETGEVISVKHSEIVWKTIWDPRSLSLLLQKPNTRAGLNSLVELLRAQKKESSLWANSTSGTLSSDGKSVFAIQDLAYPALDFTKPPFLAGGIPLKPMIVDNQLTSYHANHGKLTWGINDDREPTPPFVNSHFLGAPLFHDGRLFLLNEKGEIWPAQNPAGGKPVELNRNGTDLQLLQIDLDQKKWAKHTEPTVEKTLHLAKVPAAEQILLSPLRRSQGLHLAYADGLLVCPTHAGVLLGVDRAKLAIRWTYRYRDEKAAVPNLPHWQAACPIIYKERIVLSTADAPEIHCLDFDGKKKWTATDPSGLYVATVQDDIVLVVGKTHCRALKLADGTEKWKLETGLPAGVGVKDGSTYYLPLQAGALNKKPAIWAIDLVKGTKVRAIDVPYPDALGNLALHRGLFVSQSVTHIAAFPLPAHKAP